MNSERICQNSFPDYSYLRQGNRTQINGGSNLNYSTAHPAVNSSYYGSNNSVVMPMQYMPSRLENSTSCSDPLLSQTHSGLHHFNNLQNEVSQHSSARNGHAVLFRQPGPTTVGYNRTNVKTINNSVPLVPSNNKSININKQNYELVNLLMSNGHMYRKPSHVTNSWSGMKMKSVNNNIPTFSNNNYSNNEFRVQYSCNGSSNILPRIHVKDVTSLNNSVANENLNTTYQNHQLNHFGIYKPVCHQRNFQLTDSRFENVSPVDSINTNQFEQYPISVNRVHVSSGKNNHQEQLFYVNGKNSQNQLSYSSGVEKRSNLFSNVICQSNINQNIEVNPRSNANSQSMMMPNMNYMSVSSSEGVTQTSSSQNMMMPKTNYVIVSSNEGGTPTSNSRNRMMPKTNYVSVSSYEEETPTSNTHITSSAVNSLSGSNCNNIVDNLKKTTSQIATTNFSENFQNDNNNYQYLSLDSLLRTALSTDNTRDLANSANVENVGKSDFAQSQNDSTFPLSNNILLQSSVIHSTVSPKNLDTDSIERNRPRNCKENFQSDNPNNDSEVTVLDEISIKKDPGSPEKNTDNKSEELNSNSGLFKNNINRKKLDLLIEFVENDSYEKRRKGIWNESSTIEQAGDTKENFSNNCYSGMETAITLEEEKHETSETLNKKISQKNNPKSDGTSKPMTNTSAVITNSNGINNFCDTIKGNCVESDVSVILKKEVVIESDEETSDLNETLLSGNNNEKIEELSESGVGSSSSLSSPQIEDGRKTPESEKDLSASTLTDNNNSLGSAFEDPDFISSMKTFQKIKFHKCISCDLTLPNSSFWLNIISAELRCLNCFKKMKDESSRSKRSKKDPRTERKETEKKKSEKDKEVIEIKHERDGTEREKKRRRESDAEMNAKKVKASERAETSSGAKEKSEKSENSKKDSRKEEKRRIICFLTEYHARNSESKHGQMNKVECGQEEGVVCSGRTT